MMQPSESTQKRISTREWYDFIGHLADTLPGLHLGGEQATHNLLALCPINAETKVLDVGCGAGDTACRIALRYGAHVDGIDLSEVMIAKARLRAERCGLRDRVRFHVSDAFDLPFDDENFDVITLESVITPLAGEKLAAMREMVRVLRPGGRICANESTVDPAAPEEWRALFSQHPAIYGTFSPQSLRALFEEAGLEIVHLSEVTETAVQSAVAALGFWGLLSFMVRTYPKILMSLLRDARLRQAARVDDQITKGGKQYMSYTLIAGQKPSSPASNARG